MIMKESAGSTVVGYLLSDSRESRLAVPVCTRHETDGPFMIQLVDELTNSVIGFKFIQVKDDKIRFIESQYNVCPPCDPVYIFIENDKNIKVGNCSELANVFEEYEIKNRDDAKTLLQIHEILGDKNKLRSARRTFVKLLYQSERAWNAKIFLEESVLKTELWKILIASAPNEGSARRILYKRGMTGVIINNNIVEIDLSMIDGNDFGNLEVEYIKGLLQKEFDETISPHIIDDDSIDIAGNNGVEIDIREKLAEARNPGRQEERIAVLLKIILNDYSIGKHVATSYADDRSTFASQAVSLVKSVINSNFTKFSLSSRTILDLLSQLFQLCFPLNRGAFLYYLAKHIAHDKDVAIFVADKLEYSNAMAVLDWRKEIMTELNRANKNIDSNEIDFGDLFEAPKQ